MTSQALSLVAGDLTAAFLPGQGMLGASLWHRGEEILRRVDDLEQAAAKGSTAGIPLLHPSANRLSGTRYSAAGRDVELDPRSRLLHLDAQGLPMHGVPWSRLAWEVTGAASDRPWDELCSRQWRLDDRLSGDVYERDGNEIRDSGLYVELAPWQCHVFQVREP